MALINLPEQFLYRKIPEGVLNEDVRRILESIVSGYQDRLCDLRAYADTISSLFDPQTAPPDTQYVRVEYRSGSRVAYRFIPVDETTPSVREFSGHSADLAAWAAPKLGLEESAIVYAGVGTRDVQVSYFSDSGNKVTVTLRANNSTPYASDTYALKLWAANELKINLQSITDVVIGTDVLRTVDANVLQLTAATVGAILYTYTADPTRDHRFLLQGHFPRLRLKGTVASFDLLGRALGFSDVQMSPLWSRVSPRISDDIGNAENDDDFSPEPDIAPAAKLPDDLYDPWETDDGVFFTWPQSRDVVWSVDTTADNYLLRLNGKCPFFRVVIATEVSALPTGFFTLSGGTGQAKASAALGDSGVTLEALFAGESANGMRVQIEEEAGGYFISTTHRLSAVKYRSSYFNLSATVSADSAKTVPVRVNPDSPDTTRRPLGGGRSVFQYGSWATEVERTVVYPPRRQYDAASLKDRVVQASQDFESVRPASRFPRRTSVGLSFSDRTLYAGYSGSSVIHESLTNGSAYSAGYTSDRPEGEIGARFCIERAGTFYPLTGEVDVDNSRRVNFWQGNPYVGQVRGWYDFGSHTYQIASDGLPLTAPSARVVALWVPSSTETLRSDPASDRMAGYQVRPEDLLERDDLQQVDDMPWMRHLSTGGEVVDLSVYRPSSPDFTTVPLDYSKALIETHTSERLRVLVDDRSPRTNVPRIKYRPVSAITEDGSPLDTDRAVLLSALPAAGSSAVYPAGLVLGVPVANPVSHFPLLPGLVGWFPFNEHPADKLDIKDATRFESGAYKYISISPDDRQWDDQVGWNLRLAAGSSVQVYQSRGLSDELTLAGWVKPDPAYAYTGDSTLCEFGPLRAVLASSQGSVTVLAAGSVAGTIPLTEGFNAFAISVSNGSARFFGGTVDTAMQDCGSSVQSAWSQWEAPYLLFRPESQPVHLHDYKIWDRAHGSSILDIFRKPTLYSAYDLEAVPVLNTALDDYYVFRTLPTGWLYPARSDQNLARRQWARVVRYRKHGEFEGPQERELTGLGGGQPLPEDGWKLGHQGRTVRATGQTVVSTQDSSLPGYADGWMYGEGSYPRVTPATGSVSFDGYLSHPEIYIRVSGAGTSSVNGVYIPDGTYLGYPKWKLEGAVTGILLNTIYWNVAQQKWRLSDDTAYRYETPDLSTWTSVNGGSDPAPTVRFFAAGSTPWPSYAEAQNPAQQAIYAKGDDDETYRLTLSSSGSQVSLVPQLIKRTRSSKEKFYFLKTAMYEATLGYVPVDQQDAYEVSMRDTATEEQLRETALAYGVSGSIYDASLLVEKAFLESGVNYPDAPAGAETRLHSTTHRLSVAGSTVSTVAVDGTPLYASPPVYLYLKERAAINLTEPEVLSRYLPQEDETTPARSTQGALEFINSETLEAGKYVLDLGVGNDGTLDPEFAGYICEISLGEVVVQATLLQNPDTLQSPTGNSRVSFELAEPLAGPWVLSVNWLNPKKDASKNQIRALHIHTYAVLQTVTELYRVSVGTGLEFDQVDTNPAVVGINPPSAGGWSVALNHHGSAVRFDHESRLFAESSPSPLAAVRTWSTQERLDDLLKPAFLLPDEAATASPAGSSLTPAGQLCVDAGSSISHCWRRSPAGAYSFCQAVKTHPYRVELTMDGPVDDDLRVDIDGSAVFNPRQRQNWYGGGSTVRSVVLQGSNAHSSLIGCQSVLDAYAFDGWAATRQSNTWTAKVLWTDGGSTFVAGGSATGVLSSYPGRPTAASLGISAGSYENNGPWFEDYYPMGTSVRLQPPVPAQQMVVHRRYWYANNPVPGGFVAPVSMDGVWAGQAVYLYGSLSAPPSPTAVLYKAFFDGSYVTAWVEPGSRNAPEVNAGGSRTLNDNHLITLPGTASDPDGDPLLFGWYQTSGSTAQILDRQTVTPTVRIPAPGSYAFQLTAYDGWDISQDMAYLRVDYLRKTLSVETTGSVVEDVLFPYRGLDGGADTLPVPLVTDGSWNGDYVWLYRSTHAQPQPDAFTQTFFIAGGSTTVWRL